MVLSPIQLIKTKAELYVYWLCLLLCVNPQKANYESYQDAECNKTGENTHSMILRGQATQQIYIRQMAGRSKPQRRRGDTLGCLIVILRSARISVVLSACFMGSKKKNKYQCDKKVSWDWYQVWTLKLGKTVVSQQSSHMWLTDEAQLTDVRKHSGAMFKQL